jgi:hypothetical protein
MADAVFNFIRGNTEMRLMKIAGSYGFAFNPFPPGIKHKRKWIGIAIDDAKVADTLAKYFAELASLIRDKEMKDAISEASQKES